MDNFTRPLSFFIAGGTVRRDAECYVTRAADDQLLNALRRGEFCYLLTSRQMGKSSLMVRTAGRLRREGVAVAVADLTAFGVNLRLEQWYDRLLNRIGSELDVENELDAYWHENDRLPPLARFVGGLTEIVLRRVPGSVVIFIDEIDVTRSLRFSVDEFFAAIRELYNRRTEEPDLCRLTFCLLGVASPSDLISDVRMTPFNIGRRIVLTDFTRQEALPLINGFTACATPIEGVKVLERVLFWTGGHPFLTQKLCETVSARFATTPKEVDTACRDLFLVSTAREKEDNLIFVRDRMLRCAEDESAVLGVYRRVLSGKSVQDDDADPIVNVLRLAGIVRNSNGKLAVRNRIYERAFDLAWVQASMPWAEARRQRAAFSRGWKSAALVSLVLMPLVYVGYKHLFRRMRVDVVRATPIRPGGSVQIKGLWLNYARVLLQVEGRQPLELPVDKVEQSVTIDEQTLTARIPDPLIVDGKQDWHSDRAKLYVRQRAAIGLLDALMPAAIEFDVLIEPRPSPDSFPTKVPNGAPGTGNSGTAAGSFAYSVRMDQRPGGAPYSVVAVKSGNLTVDILTIRAAHSGVNPHRRALLVADRLNTIQALKPEWWTALETRPSSGAVAVGISGVPGDLFVVDATMANDYDMSPNVAAGRIIDSIQKTLSGLRTSRQP